MSIVLPFYRQCVMQWSSPAERQRVRIPCSFTLLLSISFIPVFITHPPRLYRSVGAAIRHIIYLSKVIENFSLRSISSKNPIATSSRTHGRSREVFPAPDKLRIAVVWEVIWQRGKNLVIIGQIWRWRTERFVGVLIFRAARECLVVRIVDLLRDQIGV